MFLTVITGAVQAFTPTLAAAAQTIVTVFAAASLNAVFTDLGRRFETDHPGVSVRFDFDGSHILEAQLAQGAQADVFASADLRWMRKAQGDGLVGRPDIFASNALVVAAAPGSAVRSAADLSRPGLRLILCSDAAPCGAYARAMLSRMDGDPAFGKDFSAAVVRNVVSEEQNVEDVLAHVLLGEADAGIVYRSDAVRAGAKVRVVELPQALQPAIEYPIATLVHGAAPAAAQQFVAFVRSAQGRAVLRSYGFGPAP